MVISSQFVGTSPVLLIDGSNLLVRLLYVRQSGSNLLPENELIADVAAMFIRSVATSVRTYAASGLYVTMDIGGSVRKQNLDSSYKANRDFSGMAKATGETQDYVRNVYTQLRDKVVKMLRSFNIPVFYEPGIEADDAIGIMAETFSNAGQRVVIISNDSDFFQLLKYKLVSCYVPYKKTLVTMDTFPDFFNDIKKVKIHASDYLFYKAIVGDKTDSIDGVKGIGYKTLFKLVDEFFSANPDLAKVYSEDPELFIKEVSELPTTHKLGKIITENKSRLLLNYKLIELSTRVSTANTVVTCLDFIKRDTATKPKLTEVSGAFKSLFGFQFPVEDLMVVMGKLTTCYRT